MNEQHQREEALFDAALELPSAERGVFLNKACAENHQLRQRIESLLESHEKTSGVLEQALENKSNTILTQPSEKPGDLIGRYKLLQQIGEGGCGVVYMAEQEEPVRRRVALKIIKLGMDTKQVITRFEAERQALAMMDHPNIAKVLDAGATETGRPYFVMELVRGTKITDYCDENNFSPRQRLDLFMQVCRAIQHAHQKGIIHRDIKPSNILVTLHDAEPMPMVIDFGIAKATGGLRLTDQTLFTAFEQFLGTPAYMSPEQAQLTSQDIDTRSDIYSLGVLLYEILTGKTPFETKELLQVGLEEMLRTIREKEPARPSTRLSTMLKDELTAAARHRQTEAPKLVQLLSGDLDWIVMKSLEKDRTQRYETANGLAMDLHRHLNNEPILARPPSSTYRLRKLVRRNRLAFAAAGAVALALVLGVIGSTVQAMRAMRAEREQTHLRRLAESSQKKSETEAAKATAISDFLQQMLRSASPDTLKGSDYTVRQMLDDFSGGLANQLKDQPEVEADVRAVIGKAYSRLGVGDTAQMHLERALTLRRRIFGNNAAPVAESLVDYAWNYYEQDQPATGEPYAREALEIYRKRGSSSQQVISALWVLQKLESAQGKNAEAEAVTQEAMAIADKFSGSECPELASMIHALAEVKNEQSKYAEGEALARKAVGMHRRLQGAEHPETAWALRSLGVALRGQHKLAEAETVLREALQIFQKYYSSAHQSVALVTGDLKGVLEAKGDTAALEALAQKRIADANKQIERNSADPQPWIERALAHTDLNQPEAALEDYTKASAIAPNDAELKLRIGDLRRGQGEFAEAESVYREALAIHRRMNIERREVADALHSFGAILQNQGKLAEADAAYRDALAMKRKLFGDDDETVPWSLCGLGSVLQTQGKLSEAETLYREAVATQLRLLSGGHADVTSSLLDSLNNLDSVLRQQGKPPEGKSLALEAIARQKKFLGTNQLDVAAFLGRLAGSLLWNQNDPGAAEFLCRESLAIRKSIQGPEHSDIAYGLHDLAVAVARQGKYAEAEVLYREAVVMKRKVLSNENETIPWSLHGLGDALQRQGKLPEAEAAYREALTIQRVLLGKGRTDVTNSFFDSINHLAAVLIAEDKATEAFTLYREAADRANAGAQNSLGRMYAKGQGVPSDPAEAVKWYRKAADQGHRDAQLRLASMYARGRGVPKDPDEAAKWYGKAAEKTNARSLNEVAWTLATSKDPELRDGTNAVMFAEQAVSKSNRKDPVMIDTLAAAYAEAGQFQNAVAVQKEAISLLRTDEERNDYASRLKLYEANTPYHEK